MNTSRAASNRAALRGGAGTIASRFTGLLRLVVIAYALGSGTVADPFNLANQTPNMVHDLVLGGILGASFVPVFVERLTRSRREEAEASISAVITLSLVLLVVATVIFEVAAPYIIDLYTFHHGPASERALATTFLRWFAPQLFFYGAISLMGAVLATRGRFVAVGIVPVVNNLVGIVVLLAFAQMDSAAKLGSISSGKVALLGLGTTAGVAAQALALVPSMRASGIRLRLAWRPHDPAIRTILALSTWTIGFVIANQVAVFVVLALEYHSGNGGVSDYTYAYQFFQMPFGVAATAIVSVATPSLSRAWANRDARLMGQRFGVAIRQMLAIILPSTVAYLVLAKPLIELILEYGRFSAADATTTASCLALFALGLPGYCVYFLSIRTFQSMQDTRTAFYCYLLENALNIGLAVLLYRSLGVRGLALSYSIAYTLAALVTLVVLRERLGTIGGRRLVRSTLHSGVLALVMAVVLAFVATLTGTSSGVTGWAKLVVTVLAGAVVYFGGAGLAGTLTARDQADRRVAPGRGR